ncbi:hypothetical protein [Dinghuibacter silviterrae]|uniref:Uncharacterized protein n=1 Tax=Dinghuibacter silviterrae TaxID=1539049 RepID=A0A4R8DU84_9BACT|nr:hypothetical protein [Dinghuibacter silviterrae]TDX01476.1 hypothetical protein EDB95_2512 [Dinghuibacter silviterrae]
MTQRKKTTYALKPLLRAIKGMGKDRSELERLSEAAWTFTHCVLWNDVQFSSKEIRAAQRKIDEFLQLSKTPRQSFQSFCQRIVLARFHMLYSCRESLPLPSAWLDRANVEGFGGTKQPYAEIKALRESLPGYQRELKALGEAVLEFSEDPIGRNYRYWSSYFKDKHEGDYLRLFQSFAITHLYTA